VAVVSAEEEASEEDEEEKGGGGGKGDAGYVAEEICLIISKRSELRT